MSISINDNNFGYTKLKEKCVNKFSKNVNFSNKKIKKKTSTSINEIKIGRIIKSIPNFEYYFSPIIHASNTIIRDCKLENSNIINEFNIISNYTFLISITYNYTNDIKLINIINNWKYYLKNKEKLYLFFFECYQHLLETIIILQKYKITYLNFNITNIYINDKTHLPFISEFTKSIHNNDPKKTLLTIKKIDEKLIYLYPFEIYIIYHLLNNCDDYYKDISKILSDENISIIADEYIKNNKYYKKFNDKDYKKICISLLESYKTNTYKELIVYLLKQNTYWDNYQLSIVILDCIEEIFTENIYMFLHINKNCMLTEWIDILKQNINPSFMMRNCVEYTKKITDKILFNNNMDTYKLLLDHSF